MGRFDQDWILRELASSENRQQARLHANILTSCDAALPPGPQFSHAGMTNCH